MKYMSSEAIEELFAEAGIPMISPDDPLLNGTLIVSSPSQAFGCTEQPPSDTESIPTGSKPKSAKPRPKPRKPS